MATDSSILAWRVPMDRGAWRVTVSGVTKSWVDWVTKCSNVTLASSVGAAVSCTAWRRGGMVHHEEQPHLPSRSHLEERGTGAGVASQILGKEWIPAVALVLPYRWFVLVSVASCGDQTLGHVHHE